ncbi:MAG: serine hydrolase, partial [Saprospiraceae bacterium]|nr:serine hydrolase [Saprospiraceae bacterium]
DGGLSASVADLLKIGTALADGTLLPASALERMLSPTPIGPIAIDYGLGVKSGNYHGQPCWGHSGGYKGTG